MANKEVEYAVRISKVKGRFYERIKITFGPRCNIPSEYKYVNVGSWENRLVFIFTKEKHEFSKGIFKFRKTAKLSRRSVSYTIDATICQQELNKYLEEFIGEYEDFNVQTANIPESKSFYINASNKSKIIEYDKKSTDCIADILDSPKEDDFVSEEEVKNAVMSSIHVQSSNEEVAKEFIQDVANGLKKVDEAKHILELREEENRICMDIIKRAEECTSIMSNGVSTLLEHRLLRRKLSVGEAEGNAEFNKIIIKYIKLEMAIKDLMYNVRHTWDDGRGLYDSYKQVKEQHPDIDIQAAAAFLNVSPDELHETIEAVERILGDTKERARIGFTVED